MKHKQKRDNESGPLPGLYEIESKPFWFPPNISTPRSAQGRPITVIYSEKPVVEAFQRSYVELYTGRAVPAGT